MLGIIYLMISGILGYEITEGLLGQRKADRMTGINRIWFVLPVAFGTGTLMMTWAVYVVSWLFSVCAGAENPLLWESGGFSCDNMWPLCIIYMQKEKR